MRDMNRKLILFLLAMAVFISCAADVPQQNTNWTVTAGYAERAVERVIDSEANVVCYVSSGGGISCMPLSLTWIKYSR